MPLPLTTFRLYGPTLICSRTAEGKLRIEGVASSTVKDMHGDQITLKALQKMAKSAMGMTVFRNHEYKVPGDVFGKVVKSKAINSGQRDKHGEEIWDLRLGIDVADEVPDTLQTYHLLERNEIKLGISVGAMVPDGGAKFDKQKAAYVVDDLDIVEASIVSLPANPRSFVDYIVKAFSGSYPSRLTDQKRQEILASLDEDTLIDTPEAEPLEAGDVGELIVHADGTGETAVIAKAGTPEAEEWLQANAGEHVLDEAEPLDEEPPDAIEAAADEPDLVGAVEEPDTAKTTISVWEDPEGGRTIEVNTGRKSPASQAAQDEEPEHADSSSKGKKATKAFGAEEAVALATETLQGSNTMLAALHGQLLAARTEIATLRDERDAALEIARTAMDSTKQLIERIGEIPVGRKTQAVAIQKDFSDLQAIYDTEVRGLMTKTRSPNA